MQESRGTLGLVLLCRMRMIMKKHPEGKIVGLDAQSAFNTLRRDYTAKILEGQWWRRDWIKDEGFQCHGDRGINFTIPQR